MVDDGGPFVFVVVRLPVSAVHPGITVVVSLGEVDEAGVGEDGHGHQDEEEAELLVSLLEGVEQGLEAGKVSDQLEDPRGQLQSRMNVLAFPDTSRN